MLVLALVSVLGAPAGADRPQPPRPVRFTLEPTKRPAAPGSTLRLLLRATIDPDWHLYAFAMPPGGPVATTVKIVANPSLSLVRLHPPPADTIPDPNFGVMSAVYNDTLAVPLSVRVSPNAQPGRHALGAIVTFQACTRRVCLPPRTDTLATTVTIGRSSR